MNLLTGTDSQQPTASGTRLQTISTVTGAPPRSVIATPTQAHGIKRQLITADIGRARQRSILKQMYDGHPPYDPAELKRRGLQDMKNVNFKRLAGIANTNIDTYRDAQFEVDEQAEVTIEYGSIGSPKGHDFSQIASEEFSGLLERWRGFESVMNKSNFNRVFYGSGMLYWDDDSNWRPQPAEAGQVLVDKDADTTLDNLDVCCIRRSWRLQQLYRKIEDPEMATRLGWNVDAVRRAIVRSAENNQNMSYSIKLWEIWNNKLKGNDLYMSYVSPGADCYGLYTREYDGSISYRLLTDYDSDEVLYTKYNIAEHFDQIINPFFLHETESLWHSIRGYAAALYNVLKVLDQTDNRILDMTFMGASLVIKPQTEVSRDKLNTLNLGPVTVLPAGVDYVTTTFPNMSQGPIITHNMLLQTLQQTGGEYQTGQQSTQTGEAPTATQNMNDVLQIAKVSTSLYNLFFNNVDTTLEEMFRRAANPNLPDKSTKRGKSDWCRAAREFQERILERGVPLSALQKPYLRCVRARPALGRGSQLDRTTQADEIISLLPLQQNSQGRMLMIKDSVTAKFGARLARRYFPAVPGKMLRIDAKTAELENGGMKSGSSFDVMDGEDAVTHLGIHLPMLMQAVQALQQNPTLPASQQTYALLVVGLPHCSAHVQVIAPDPTQKQIVQSVVGVLKKLGTVANHLQFQLKAAASQQQRASIAAAQQQTDAASKMQIESAKLALANRKQTHKENTDGIKLAMDFERQSHDIDISKIQTAIQLGQAISQSTASASAANSTPSASAPAPTQAPSQ